MNCGGCRFYRGDADDTQGTCRRYAPRPGNFLEFHALELLRDIAWSQRVAANIALPREHYHDLHKEASEAMQDANWANVDTGDWCGEWEASP